MSRVCYIMKVMINIILLIWSPNNKILIIITQAAIENLSLLTTFNGFHQSWATGSSENWFW